MFTQEGTFNAVVKAAMLANPPEWRAKDANPNDFDVCLKLARQDNEAECDWWRGEISQKYSKQKNKEHLRQCDLTLESLHGAGFEGMDLSTIEDQMVGKVVTITTKLGKENAEGKQYMNVYLGGYGPVALDKEEAKKRMAALFASGSADGNAQQEQRPAATTTPASSTASAEKPSPMVQCTACKKYGAFKSTKLCPKCTPAS